MILLPNTEKEQLFGTENQRRFLDYFHLYYKPQAWSDNGGTLPATGYQVSNLSAPEYSTFCQWDSSTITIAGVFGGAVGIDVFILGKTNADTISGVFYNGNTPVFDLSKIYWKEKTKNKIKTDTGGRIIFKDGSGTGQNIKRRLAPGEIKLDVTDQGIVIFPLDLFTATRFTIQLSGLGPVRLNKLYIGLDTKIALPAALSYPFTGMGQGNISDIGIAYGTKWPSRRSLAAEWDLFEDNDRRTLEEYIDTVQNVEPHFVLPVTEDYYIPPVYCVLDKQELSNRKRQMSWHWEKQSLSWICVN
jgi:hypothetical protein